MLVNFRNTWFAPTSPNKHDGDRVFSGAMYRKGTQEVPDYLEEYLPSSAVIIDKKKNYVEPEIDKTDTLGSVDLSRADSDMEQAVRDEAEKTRAAKPGPKSARK